ncbi:RNase adapter RapZ [Parvibacter caecicola]|uniref:RNase adapter RapZ n=1 Tax=Parvibacter caecicola TaxID=747645 RepID=UPI0023F03B0A|nr:RNase adapter RapZ [Parvibacter caecicola]
MSYMIDTQELPQVVIVTGMSGAGRTEASHIFEDLGYYCVDNLPAQLIPSLVDTYLAGPDEDRRRLAIVCDARSGQYLNTLEQQLAYLDQQAIDYRILFLDANDDKLVARYKSSRRRHPLCADGTSIAAGIQRERALLMPLRDRADFVLNTTEMLPQDLRRNLGQLFASQSERRGLSVTVYSFGFKHGAPADADLVMDVRFLPNPYYDPNMRYLTGLDAPVRDFVMFQDETVKFLRKWEDLLDVVMPGYVAEGKQQLAIAVGCTGGQHRSVALAEATGDYLKSKGYRVSVAHRDLEKAQRKTGGQE